MVAPRVGDQEGVGPVGSGVSAPGETSGAPPPQPFVPPAPPGAATLPAAPARRRSRAPIAIALIVLLIAALATGAVAANASISGQYSPERALTDYFSAQAKGDVDGMWANATFLRGDGSYHQFFNLDALHQMMALPQNKDISNVKIVSSQFVDPGTTSVTVSMTWAGAQRTHAYTVRKDAARVHDLFYDSWRVDIPSVNINVSLPNQPGDIEVDSLPLPAGASQSTIQVIEGYHMVSMTFTSLYAQASQLATGVDTDATVAFAGKLTSTATAAAAAAIKAAFPNCNAGLYYDCPNHTYHAPSTAYIYFLRFPGYPEIDYTSYIFTLSSDPTVGMTLNVLVEPNNVSASGTCAVKLTVDGSRHYNFKGDWTATLVWSNGAFVANVVPNCENAKA